MNIWIKNTTVALVLQGLLAVPALASLSPAEKMAPGGCSGAMRFYALLKQYYYEGPAARHSAEKRDQLARRMRLEELNAEECRGAV
ncbi:MAG: hypothetical protein PHV33_06975 [Elusimicrobiales bacterium]|nr:hypothetical protein [Elusimicrobiales bacterium]